MIKSKIGTNIEQTKYRPLSVYEIRIVIWVRNKERYLHGIYEIQTVIWVRNIKDRYLGIYTK